MSAPDPSTLPSLATVPVVDVREVLARPAEALVVDLRTPAEFADDHVPGAVNVPLLDDAGRALVGLAYTQESPETGFRHGQALIEGRIEQLVHQAGLQCECGTIPTLLFEQFGKIVHIGIHTARGQFALGLHGSGVLTPQHLEPATGNQLLSGRHVVPQEGLGDGLELTGVEYMHVHRHFSRVSRK